MNATKCKCGAVTVEIECESYSMRPAEFKRRFPGKSVPKRTMSCCNACVNHWATHLCGCGSGQKYGKCDMELSECKHAAQDIEAEVTKCHCDNGWGAQ